MFQKVTKGVLLKGKGEMLLVTTWHRRRKKTTKRDTI